jgi:hypothetical protein
LFEARRVDGLLGDADLFSLGRTEARRVDSGFVNSNLFTIVWLEPWRVNSSFVDSNLVTIAWLEPWRVNSSFVDSYLVTIAWLETRSVFTLCHVNLSFTVVAARDFDRDISLVVSTMGMEVWQMREFDVEACSCFFVVRSSIFTDVDVFSAARTVVTIPFAADANFFLAELLVARRKIGVV